MKQTTLNLLANFLNAFVFVILLINTKKECVDANSIISSVIMIGISFIIQIIDFFDLLGE